MVGYYTHSIPSSRSLVVVVVGLRTGFFFFVNVDRDLLADGSSDEWSRFGFTLVIASLMPLRPTVGCCCCCGLFMPPPTLPIISISVLQYTVNSDSRRTFTILSNLGKDVFIVARGHASLDDNSCSSTRLSIDTLRICTHSCTSGWVKLPRPLDARRVINGRRYWRRNQWVMSFAVG